jgi:hypothetical protein
MHHTFLKIVKRSRESLEGDGIAEVLQAVNEATLHVVALMLVEVLCPQIAVGLLSDQQNSARLSCLEKRGSPGHELKKPAVRSCEGKRDSRFLAGILGTIYSRW